MSSVDVMNAVEATILDYVVLDDDKIYDLVSDFETIKYGFVESKNWDIFELCYNLDAMIKDEFYKAISTEKWDENLVLYLIENEHVMFLVTDLEDEGALMSVVGYPDTQNLIGGYVEMYSLEDVTASTEDRLFEIQNAFFSIHSNSEPTLDSGLTVDEQWDLLQTSISNLLPSLKNNPLMEKLTSYEVMPTQMALKHA